MRQLAAAGFMVVGILALGWNDLSACGDKFILVGRGVRFQHAYAAVHPASILILINAKSRMGPALRDPDFLKTLKLAGHAVQTTTVDSAAAVLDAGRYDIVLTDVSDAMNLESQARTTASRPVVLPILYKPAATELRAAVIRFPTVLTAPDKIAHVLSVIDDTMKARLKRTSAASATD
jgi:hypothetical protein